MRYLVARYPSEALGHAGHHLNLHSVRFPLPEGSPLRGASLASHTVQMRPDLVIAPAVLRHGHWQHQEVQFLADHTPNLPCVLYDVGANSGLITRQLLHAKSQVKLAVAFEPHPVNYSLLVQNLAHLPNCVTVQAALGNEDGELPFYVDDFNAGNYSLLASSVPGKNAALQVPVKRATETNLLAQVPGSLAMDAQTWPVIWKSDTEGYDEIIVTTLPLAFWQKVRAGVMELATIDKPSVDLHALAARLSLFKHLHFSSNVGHALTVQEVLNFVSSTSKRREDLYFAKG